MSKVKRITNEIAIRILDSATEKCRKTSQTLEVGTDDFDNICMEMRSYQIHKDTLLKDGVDNDGQ